jgi:hypothetical protein
MDTQRTWSRNWVTPNRIDWGRANSITAVKALSPFPISRNLTRSLPCLVSVSHWLPARVLRATPFQNTVPTELLSLVNSPVTLEQPVCFLSLAQKIRRGIPGVGIVSAYCTVSLTLT